MSDEVVTRKAKVKTVSMDDGGSTSNMVDVEVNPMYSGTVFVIGTVTCPIEIVPVKGSSARKKVSSVPEWAVSDMKRKGIII